MAEVFCNHENNKISSSRYKKKLQNTPPGYYFKGSKISSIWKLLAYA